MLFFECIYCIWELFWEKLLFWELFWDFRDDKTFMQVRLGEQLGAVRLGRQLPSRVPCEQNKGGNVPHRLRVDDEPDSCVQLDSHGLARPLLSPRLGIPSTCSRSAWDWWGRVPAWPTMLWLDVDGRGRGSGRSWSWRLCLVFPMGLWGHPTNLEQLLKHQDCLDDWYLFLGSLNL